MLSEERANRILDLLNQKGAVSVNELQRLLSVSRETIRRDINRLATANRLRKTHGGVLALNAREPSFTERMVANKTGKQAIGRLAASLVPDGASLILDSGTTAWCVADALTERHDLTVYTNDINIAQLLAGQNNNNIHLLGGQYNHSEGTTGGLDSYAMLQNYYADFAFVVVNGVTAQPWIMDYSREGAELRSTMLALARTPVILADRTKHNQIITTRISNLDKVDYWITDTKPDEKLRAGMQKLAVEVLVAEAGKYEPDGVTRNIA